MVGSETLNHASISDSDPECVGLYCKKFGEGGAHFHYRVRASFDLSVGVFNLSFFGDLCTQVPINKTGVLHVDYVGSLRMATP